MLERTVPNHALLTAEGMEKWGLALGPLNVEPKILLSKERGGVLIMKVVLVMKAVLNTLIMKAVLIVKGVPIMKVVLIMKGVLITKVVLITMKAVLIMKAVHIFGSSTEHVPSTNLGLWLPVVSGQC